MGTFNSVRPARLWLNRTHVLSLRYLFVCLILYIVLYNIYLLILTEIIYSLHVQTVFVSVLWNGGYFVIICLIINRIEFQRKWIL